MHPLQYLALPGHLPLPTNRSSGPIGGPNGEVQILQRGALGSIRQKRRRRRALWSEVSRLRACSSDSGVPGEGSPWSCTFHLLSNEENHGCPDRLHQQVPPS